MSSPEYHAKEGYIDQELADLLIQHYLHHQAEVKPYRDTFPLKIWETPAGENKGIKDLCQYMLTVAKELAGEAIYIDNAEIVCWPPGSFMEYHTDNGGDQPDVLSSILYLNDNYTGGETVIHDPYDPLNSITISPEVGKIVYFPNGILPHEVTPVVQGTRYTLAVWYKYRAPNTQAPVTPLKYTKNAAGGLDF